MLTKDKVFIIPNVVEESRMFEWAGISFGEEEMFKLGKAMKVIILLIDNIWIETCSFEWSFPIEILGKGLRYSERLLGN
jgi:hypothetical protein